MDKYLYPISDFVQFYSSRPIIFDICEIATECRTFKVHFMPCDAFQLSFDTKYIILLTKIYQIANSSLVHHTLFDQE